MNVTRFQDPDYDKQLQKALASSSLFDAKVEESAREIIETVRRRGDAALLDYTGRFDGVKLTRSQLRIGEEEFDAAAGRADRSLKSAVRAAAQNIAHFSRQSLRKNWQSKNAQGALVGEKFDPFESVGVYIPGGTAPLVSTALMTITLARVAKCPSIVVCTPCGKEGRVNEALLYAIRQAGATETFRAGGAQAIAAMAFGTATIPKVQKIFGPGNAYVVAAKRLLFGAAAIDLLPGPSEVLVLADDSAPAAFVAADLLAQAEHGSGHERVWLATTSGKLLRAVEKEISKQLEPLSRKAFIEKALKKNGWLIHVKDLREGVALANRLAPEHCEVMTRRPREVARQITRAGALFLGPYSPTALGDYLAGPSHTLPTGGAAASFAGLTVDQFQRRTSVVEYGKNALKQSADTVERLAALEGLDAHGRSARIRLEK